MPEGDNSLLSGLVLDGNQQQIYEDLAKGPKVEKSVSKSNVTKVSKSRIT